jgi:gpW
MLTAQQQVTLQQQITDAETAYHNLMTGRMARVVVDQNGERVEFAAARKSDLYTYIQQLKAQMPSCAAAACLNNPGPPAQFVF